MVVGIRASTRSSGFEIWVAIRRFAVTSLLEKIAERICDALGSLLTIFAHLEQERPVRRSQKRIEREFARLKTAIRRKKRLKVGHTGVQGVADAFDRVERDAPHLGEAGDGRRLHVHKRSRVRG